MESHFKNMGKGTLLCSSVKSKFLQKKEAVPNAETAP
jgi:hypothetical protein